MLRILQRNNDSLVQVHQPQSTNSFKYHVKIHVALRRRKFHVFSTSFYRLLKQHGYPPADDNFFLPFLETAAYHIPFSILYIEKVVHAMPGIQFLVYSICFCRVKSGGDKLLRTWLFILQKGDRKSVGAGGMINL